MFYEILKNKHGQFYWHLKAGNGQIIAWSGETYVRKTDCQAGINLVKGSSAAPVYDRA